MKLRKIGTITVKKLHALALIGGLAFAATGSHAWAQFPTGAPPMQPTNSANSAPIPGGMSGPTKKYTRGSEFRLPIVINPADQAKLAQIRLYAKTGTSDWVQQEVAGPSAKEFIYRVPQDGEYWFTLVTIDNQGRQSPSNLNDPTANVLRVVVDTRPPVLETNVSNEFGETVLSVNVIDANPDQASIRARVLEGGSERFLKPVPGHSHKFRLTSADLSMPIRVSAGDLANNVTTKDLPAMNGSAGAVPVQTAGLPSIPGSSIPTSPTTIAPPPGASTQFGPPMLPPPSHVVTQNTAPPMQPTQSPNPGSDPRAWPSPYPNPPVMNPTPQPGGVASTAYRPNIDNDRPSDRKLINTTHAQVEYRIDKVGPSGLGKVEVFMTRDRGTSWEKLADCPNKRSPIDVDLPGEGVFGLRMVVSNGNGIGGRAPRSGDRPQFFIEVDATSPQVQIMPYEMVPGANALDIRWSATDANLGQEPVSIYWRTRQDAPWQPMARNLKNDGVYRWAFPHDVGGQVFYKLEVVDMAGNMTRVETPTPIMLDQTEPEATLLDIVGVGGNRQGGTGAPPSMPPASMPSGMPPALPSINPTMPPR